MLTVHYYRGPSDSIRPLFVRTDIQSITVQGPGLVLHAVPTTEIPERTYLVDPADIVLITATPPSPPPPRRRRSHK